MHTGRRVVVGRQYCSLELLLPANATVCLFATVHTGPQAHGFARLRN